ncbi:hypothetical protein QR680_014212 [Steinernema hermaphroditum]|uniref:PCFS4-like zinc finger domain-containing protein n=1 Tax=Steinernema hermaphroditum TaxID=289476 RepID=A0AA39I830_9BILA|nr:hypothetical protein QR680_014212 [Steinernema hermaphroditum]
MLGFREEKWIRLGAQEHVFRFGGPSRELLIDNRHFKATFGGSPIVVNINGCRHQIQLLGPPPRVVVEDRPSYDLMPKTEEKKIEVVKSERKPPSSGLSAAPALAGDVLSLLARLKEKGLLGNTKPVPEEAPSEGLLANPLFMATKNTTALQDILAPKDACGDCGLNLEGLDYQARGQHKDDHVAENLRKLGGKRDTRPWFSGRTTLWESTRSKLAGTKISKPSVENGLDAESTDSQKVCPHCREAFEEYYNQDEDLWMYRNSVVHRGTIYHRECARDLSLTL